MYEMTSFLADSWDQKIVNRFIDKVHNAVNLLADFPDMGRVADEQLGVRAITIRPYTRVYYTVTPKEIYILRVKDTRQNSNR
jgi:plasmid stabilization system protein ParE